jgi:glycosyltransferase involved in cell wall biosynthesis
VPRRRLLFLSIAFPLPAHNGHKMRMWALLRALAHEGHRITLLTFAEAHPAADAYRAVHEICASVEIVPLALTNLSERRDYLMRACSLASRLPYSVRRFVSASMAERIRRRVSDERFDAIICDTIFVLPNLPHTRVPVILNNVDVEHVILERYAACERNPARRLYCMLEAFKLRRFEQAACRRAALRMVCSGDDEALLRLLWSEGPMVVVPNVVDTDEYRPDHADVPVTALFQGAMDWYPNRDAVLFFVREILPEIRRQVPGVQFRVAGRQGPTRFQELMERVPGVTFSGTVPDIRVEVARSTVCVVPLRIGSGTRLKILEAAAMGRPIVSTRVGAEGLELRDGEEILIADDPHGFARSVVALLSNPERCRALGAAARRKVERTNSIPVLREALRTALAAAGL